MRWFSALSLVVLPIGVASALGACSDDDTVPPGSSGLDAALEASRSDAPAADGAGEASAEAAAPDAGTPDTSIPDATVSDADAAIADAADAADASTLDASDASDAIDANDASFGVGALKFDGVNDIVALPVAVGAASETAFTIELWFKTTSQTGTMFEVYGGGGADRFVFVEAGKACFYVYGTPVVEICSTAATYADGAWHHIAGTLGTVGGTRLYVDGAPAANLAAPTSSNFTTDNAFRLGYGHIGFSSPLYYFSGSIDEVRVWSVERSAAEIAASYQQGVAANTAGLQGYWKLDGTGSSVVATDETAGAHHGTLSNFAFDGTSGWSGPGAF